MVCMCRQTLMNHVYQGNLECVRFSNKAVFFTEEDLGNFILKFKTKYEPTHIN
jgi:hypothetical protein